MCHFLFNKEPVHFSHHAVGNYFSQIKKYYMNYSENIQCMPIPWILKKEIQG